MLPPPRGVVFFERHYAPMLGDCGGHSAQGIQDVVATEGGFLAVKKSEGFSSGLDTCAVSGEAWHCVLSSRGGAGRFPTPC